MLLNAVQELVAELLRRRDEQRVAGKEAYAAEGRFSHPSHSSRWRAAGAYGRAYANSELPPVTSRYCLPSSSTVAGAPPIRPMFSCQTTLPSLDRSGQQVAAGVAGNCQVGIRREDTRRGTAARVRVFPGDLPGLVVDGAEEALSREPVVRPGPAVCAVLGLVEVDAVAVLGVDDQQPRLGVEARRPEVRGAALIGRDQGAVLARLLGGIRNRTALLVDALGSS